DGIRDFHVTGVQTCALPISGGTRGGRRRRNDARARPRSSCEECARASSSAGEELRAKNAPPEAKISNPIPPRGDNRAGSPANARAPAPQSFSILLVVEPPKLLPEPRQGNGT